MPRNKKKGAKQGAVHTPKTSSNSKQANPASPFPLLSPLLRIIKPSPIQSTVLYRKGPKKKREIQSHVMYRKGNSKKGEKGSGEFPF